MARIVFMGTPDFGVPSLEWLIAEQQVVGVVTQPDRQAGRGKKVQPPPIKIVAQKAGIPVYQPNSLRSIESAGPLYEWQPELIVVAAFGQILRPHVLELPPAGCLNIHASLLPRWRGASPIQHALLSGDKKSGISLMKMDEGMDTGPVYVKEAIPIQGNDTAATLHDRLATLGGQLLSDYLADILSGRLRPTPQDDSAATYAPLIKKEDGQIDWGVSADQIDRHIRAMTPWPSAYTTWKEQLLKVWEAEPIDRIHQLAGEPGSVVDYQGNVAVIANPGGIRLKRIQLAGKRAVPVEDFIRGQGDFIGSMLGDQDSFG